MRTPLCRAVRSPCLTVAVPVRNRERPPALATGRGRTPRVMGHVDVLILTCGRLGALTVTLAGLIGQTDPDLRIVLGDQTEGLDVAEVAERRPSRG